MIPPTKRIPIDLINSHFKDIKIADQIESRLFPYFYKEITNNDVTTYVQEKESRSRVQKKQVLHRSRRVEQSQSSYRIRFNNYIKDEFNYPSGYSIPFINQDLRSHILGTNPKSVFKIYEAETRSSTAKKDKESIRKYSSVCRRLPRHLIDILWCSSESATAHLGLTDKYFYSKKTFRPLSRKQSIDFCINNANAGYPTFRKKNNKAAIKDATLWLDKILDKPNIYSFFKNILLVNPKILMHRFQPRIEGEKLITKCRQVWCESFRTIALENYFFRNIIQESVEYNKQGLDVTSSNGLRNSEISAFIVSRIRSLIGTSKHKSVYCQDFSKFDRSIHEFFIDLYFYRMREHLILNETEENIYNLLRYYTKFGPISFDKQITFKRRGISSGSLLTNHFDTFVNLVLQYSSKTLLENNKSTEDIRSSNFKCKLSLCYRYDNAATGDDGMIYTYKLEIILLQELCSYLGMDLDILLETNDPNAPIFFLGRYWDSYNEPFQSEQYMTGHICFRSKWYKKTELKIDISEELEASRIISICCPFSNGYSYMMKTFYNYKPLINLLNKKKFLYLKDYPLEQYNTFKNISDVSNWRMF